MKNCFNVDTTANDHSYQPNQNQIQQLENDLRRLERFLEQARVDPSLSGGILTKWEETLNRHLDVQSQRYQYATLYGQLVTEWLSPDKKQAATASVPSTDVEMGDGFEELPGKKRLEAREQFENAVFTSANVDEDAIKRYLNDLFNDEEGSEGRNTRKSVTALRKSTQHFEVQLAKPDQFNTVTVTRCIAGLLKGSLFVGEKRTVLKNFQNNEIILSEIADVLNMRMSALPTWSWEATACPLSNDESSTAVSTFSCTKIYYKLSSYNSSAPSGRCSSKQLSADFDVKPGGPTSSRSRGSKGNVASTTWERKRQDKCLRGSDVEPIAEDISSTICSTLWNRRLR